MLTLKGRFVKKTSDAEKTSGIQINSEKLQSNSAKAHLSLYLKSKGNPPKKMCEDDLYFDFTFNLNH